MPVHGTDRRVIGLVGHFRSGPSQRVSRAGLLGVVTLGLQAHRPQAGSATVHEGDVPAKRRGDDTATAPRYVRSMRLPLIEGLDIGNSGAVTNARRDQDRRRRQDETIDRLVAALSGHGPPPPTGVTPAPLRGRDDGKD